MKKEEWLQIREQEELPMWVIYRYYRDMGGYVTDATEFTKLFVETTSSSLTVINGKPVNYHTAIKRVYDYFDNKFEII